MEVERKRDKFVALARGTSKQRHAAVLQAATDLFVANKRPSHSESTHFEELSLRLLAKIDMETRIEIAERLAICKHLPKQTALTLALDDYIVAAPLLRLYKGFAEVDLLKILEKGDFRHALTIAERPDTTDKIALALSKMQPTGVRNSKTIRRAYPEGAEEIKSTPETQDNMARLEVDIEDENSSLTFDAPQIAELLKIKSGERRGRKNPLDVQFPGLMQFLKGDINKVLEIADAANQAVLESDHDPAELLKKAYRRAERALDFRRFARNRDPQGFAKLMALECNLILSEADKVIEDNSGFALAICLKSLALPAYVANEAFILLNPAIGEDSKQFFLLEWFYDKLSPAAARHIQLHWTGAELPKKPSSHGYVPTAPKTLAESQSSRARNTGAIKIPRRSRQAAETKRKA